mmetsp:Transcript_32649/g.36658  ORF Transcript_32649/g.36658 Transcript_32649/m.36658 type:complete len:301 (-) Transcript_32649:235-1137(-)
MNTMINNISFPSTNRRRQITTSSGNKIPGSNSVGHTVWWGQKQRQGKGMGGCDSNHRHRGIIRTPLNLDKADGSLEEEEEEDDEDNEGTTSTEFTFDLDDDSTMSLNISDAAFSSTTTTTVDSIAAANDNDECVPSSTITTATSAASTREHNTLHNTKKKTSRHRHQVHFGSIEIHEHTIQLGGAGIPSTSGPSLSLSWHKQGPSTTIASVIEYEEARSCSRKGIEMLHSRTQRIDVLLSVGYTYREIMECTKACDTIRTQRLQTRKQIQLSTFWINLLRGKTRRNKLLLREKKKKKNRN